MADSEEQEKHKLNRGSSSISLKKLHNKSVTKKRLSETVDSPKPQSKLRRLSRELSSLGIIDSFADIPRGSRPNTREHIRRLDRNRRREDNLLEPVPDKPVTVATGVAPTKGAHRQGVSESGLKDTGATSKTAKALAEPLDLSVPKKNPRSQLELPSSSVRGKRSATANSTAEKVPKQESSRKALVKQHISSVLSNIGRRKQSSGTSADRSKSGTSSNSELNDKFASGSARTRMNNDKPSSTKPRTDKKELSSTETDGHSDSSDTGAAAGTSSSGKTLASGFDLPPTGTESGSDSSACFVLPGLQSSSGSTSALPGSSGSSSDDPDSERIIQQFLGQRFPGGVPPELLGMIGPRMQHIIARLSSSSTMQRVGQILHDIQCATTEEDVRLNTQLTAVSDLCQILVMNTEDSLGGFPARQFVPALVELLKLPVELFDDPMAEMKLQLVNTSCRALTYMVDTLPRSASVVVDAVPILVERLQNIQCMEIAEQSITALELLSRRHARPIIQANGVAACLSHIDFFDMLSQQKALLITANCCRMLQAANDFDYVKDYIELLTERLTMQSDKKAVESVCQCFCHLVDNYMRTPNVLKQLVGHGLFCNIQQLLVLNPPIVSPNTFVSVLRMLANMCAGSPDLAVLLLKRNQIADTICFLLTRPSVDALSAVGGAMELQSRSPQELLEIVTLVAELMPPLPTTGVFEINSALDSGKGSPLTAIWQWQDELGHWRPYSESNSRLIEAARQRSDDEVLLNIAEAGGNCYIIDLSEMHQINEDTGTIRNVQRIPYSSDIAASTTVELSRHEGVECIDTRTDTLYDNTELACSFTKTLLPVLFEVYSSSVGSQVRHKCLHALLRILCMASPDLLREVLRSQPISSHIASMLSPNTETRAVVVALQMADMLLYKLPEVFTVYFHREGVVYEIERLANGMTEMTTSSSFSSDITSSSNSAGLSNIKPSEATLPKLAARSSIGKAPAKLSIKNSSRKTGDRDPIGRSSRTGGLLPTRPSIKYSSGKGVSKRQSLMERETRDSPNGSQGSSKRLSLPARHNAPGDKEPSSSRRPSSRGIFGNLPWSSKSFGNETALDQTKTSSHKETTLDCARGASHSSFDLRHLSHISSSKELKERDMKIQKWIRSQASSLLEKFRSEASKNSTIQASMNSLQRLSEELEGMTCGSVKLNILKKLAHEIQNGDASAFEVNHSGIVGALLSYFLSLEFADQSSQLVSLRQFAHVFIGCPLEKTHPLASVGMDLPGEAPIPLSNLITKLIQCLHLLEQFYVKIDDVGTNAMRFFSSHQLKCQLLRHPDCKNLREWRAGPVKIDPLAQVQAIERYLVTRGYHRRYTTASSDDEVCYGSDHENLEDSMAGMMLGQSGDHRLEFLVGTKVLPYHMTVYQAIRSCSSGDTDSEQLEQGTTLSQDAIWYNIHTIHYRPVSEQRKKVSNEHLQKKETRTLGGRDTRNSKADPLWVNGDTPPVLCPLLPYLKKILVGITIEDQSIHVLKLLRILHALNRYWYTLYDRTDSRKPALPENEFISYKLNSKVSRQLQDPLAIMHGNFPKWITEICPVCPFLFPFETRHLFFYVTSFDRDRALKRLQGELADAANDTRDERVTPRIDRKKFTVSRKDLLSEAKRVFEDSSHSKAIIEVQYENEAGTGLGPTLEFYSLTSRELQRSDLELWRGDSVEIDIPLQHADTKSRISKYFIKSQRGLFPLPLSRSTKHATVQSVKKMFHFMGRFVARAILDLRIIDLPLSLVFYKFLLGMETTLNRLDLEDIDPVVANSVKHLQDILLRKQSIDVDKNHNGASRQSAVQELSMADGNIEDLDLDFILPGHHSFELKRGGKDISVTLNNLEEYLNLLCYWTLREGVSRQMEAFREGFETVFPLQHLQVFYPEELEYLLCGNQSESWEIKMLMECCRPDHGYNHDSRSIKFFYEILSSYGITEQRQFLQFVTGCPRLPVGGFKSLSPPLTIVRKDLSHDTKHTADDYLPSVMTCKNYLKLPDYSTIDVMRSRMHTAINDGQLAFQLS